jgi:hypothetical protein
MNKVFLVILLAVVILVVLAGCAASPNELVNVERVEGEGTAGFWLGLWHGFISPVTFIISLFNSNVGIYEVHNNGNWYNFGFLLGATIIFGGGGGGSCRGRRK